MAAFKASPLHLVPGYGVPGSGEGDWAAVADRLSNARNYWIITVRADGRPHAAPVWGAWIDDAVWFSTDAKSVKGRNLADRPDVVVHLESGDEVTVVEGVAGPPTIERYDAYRAEYRRKYDIELPEPDEPDATTFVVVPRRILTWTEREFPGSGVVWTPAER